MIFYSYKSVCKQLQIIHLNVYRQILDPYLSVMNLERSGERKAILKTNTVTSSMSKETIIYNTFFLFNAEFLLQLYYSLSTSNI